MRPRRAGHPAPHETTHGCDRDQDASVLHPPGARPDGATATPKTMATPNDVAMVPREIMRLSKIQIIKRHTVPDHSYLEWEYVISRFSKFGAKAAESK